MIKRVRRLKISLGAKCRILFGAAIALIIGAALYVPWQRMEQLTEQLDRSAAGALAEQAVQRHVLLQMEQPKQAAVTDEGPTTAPAAPDIEPVARLTSIKTSRGGPDRVRFERRAFDRFVASADRRWDSGYYVRPDGTEGYRYA